MTIPNSQDNSKSLKDLELLHRHVLNQHFSALALGPQPNLIEPRLAQIIEREPYLDTPIDEARKACALDARRLCPIPENKAILHCLGMADLKLNQAVTEQCRAKVKMTIPYACSVESAEHGCTGIDKSLLKCLEEKAGKLSGDCADSVYLTIKFLKILDTTKKSLDDRKAAQSRKPGNGMSVAETGPEKTTNGTAVAPQQGFTVARSSAKIVSEKVAMEMIKESDEVTEFAYGLILIVIAAGVSVWACLFASPRRLANEPAIVSVKEVTLEVRPLLNFDDSSKNEVLL